ncbi:MAG: hypothetical protein CL946_05110 [Ectothiorhodospiraceae bacterium]|nr:hypothetical protein [Ectothiorhodospiraceae bacterium]
MKSFMTRLMFAFTLLALSATAQTQLTVQLEGVVTDSFPKVTAKVTTRLNGALYKQLDETNVRVWENGVRQENVTIECKTGTNNFSLAFLVGNGQGYSDGDVNGAKGIADRMIDLFEEGMDYGSPTGYARNQGDPVIISGFKEFTFQIKPQLNVISRNDKPNSLYDFLVAAAQETLANANAVGNQEAGVVVFTNGSDQSSSQNQTQAETALLGLGVRIFIVPVGSGLQNESWLRMIADSTGGIFFENTLDIEQRIVNVLRGTPDYCEVSYETKNLCRDGAERDITVRIRISDDSAQAMGTFAPSIDPGTNADVTIAVDDVTGTSGTQFAVPVTLQTDVTGQPLYAGTVSLSYDKTKLTLDSVGAFTAMAKNNVFQVQQTAPGADITIAGTSILNGSGTLFNLYFSAPPVTADEDVTVELSAFDLQAGCLNITRENGTVTLVPPQVELSITAPNYQFVWDDNTHLYDPPTHTIEATVMNDGDKEATGVTATLTLVPQVQLASGALTVDVEPSDLAPGESGTAQWIVKAVPQSQNRSVRPEISATSNEGGDDNSTVLITISEASSAVAFTCDVEDVTVDGGAHTPDPVNATATMTGAGANGGPNGEVELVLPAGITLAAGSLVEAFPATSLGGIETLTWSLQYPSLETTEQYELTFIIRGPEIATDTCKSILTVPGLTPPSLTSTCLDAPELIDYSAGYWQDNPFTVSTEIENTGTTEITDIVATLSVTSELILLSPAAPPLNDTLQPGETATLNWTVSVDTTICDPALGIYDLEVTVNGNSLFTCSDSTSILSAANEDPVLMAISPTEFEIMLKQGATQVFEVDVTDEDMPNLARMDFNWMVDGSPVTGTTSYNYTASGTTSQTVTLVVTDRCGKAATLTWTVNIDTSTSVNDWLDAAALGYEILGNYPNPFNPGTVLEYRVPDGEHRVALELYDSNGRFIRTLIDDDKLGGMHSYQLDMNGMPSGTYYVRLRSGRAITLHKVSLVR